jgi:hypothetical protein
MKNTAGLLERAAFNDQLKQEQNLWLTAESGSLTAYFR